MLILAKKIDLLKQKVSIFRFSYVFVKFFRILSTITLSVYAILDKQHVSHETNSTYKYLMTENSYSNFIFRYPMKSLTMTVASKGVVFKYILLKILKCT
jgi:hypothetical protein